MAASRAQDGPGMPTFHAGSQPQEIQVLSDRAFIGPKLMVEITRPGGQTPMKRAGHTLEFFRETNGRWALARDANLLTTVDSLSIVVNKRHSERNGQ